MGKWWWGALGREHPKKATKPDPNITPLLKSLLRREHSKYSLRHPYGFPYSCYD